MLIDVAFYRLVCKLHDSHLIKALESALSKPITSGFIKVYHWWIYQSLSLVDLSKSITGGFSILQTSLNSQMIKKITSATTYFFQGLSRNQVSTL